LRLEQSMADEPLASAREAKKLGAREKEHPPPLDHPCWIGGARQRGERGVLFTIEIREPSLRRLRVLAPVDDPLPTNLERHVELVKEVRGRHDPAREEVTAHPVVIAFGFERVGPLLV